MNMQKIILFIISLTLSLSLVGCQSRAYKHIAKKAAPYVRDRERDYHKSAFAPKLKIPAHLRSPETNLEYAYELNELFEQGSDVALEDIAECVDIYPPGLD